MVVALTASANAASQMRRVAQDGYGSWLRDNALTRPATVHDPVNLVRHGQSEQFFPVGRSGSAPESLWGVLGKVWSGIGTQGVSTLTG